VGDEVVTSPDFSQVFTTTTSSSSDLCAVTEYSFVVSVQKRRASPRLRLLMPLLVPCLAGELPDHAAYVHRHHDCRLHTRDQVHQVPFICIIKWEINQS
jgi:hypothetical protein